MTAADVAGRRRAEIVGALGALRVRISDACTAVGRDPHSVTLIAVTKTYPASDVLTLANLGVLDVGENRDQEAAAKVSEVVQRGVLGGGATGVSAQSVRWHFLGRLQSRKCRSVAGYAHSVHSVDRPEIVAGLADAVARTGRPPLETYVQVSLDGDPQRGGAVADEVMRLADDVASRPGLILRGVMAVAPLEVEPDEAFARLAGVSRAVREAHPAAVAISAGMSADLVHAIRHGSTHVRVGSALLGPRSSVFG